jgi:LysM repeat protein
MQARNASSLRLRLMFGLMLLLAFVVLLQPVVSHAAPLGADTVVYVVKPGDTLRSIAAAYGTTMSAIVRANNMANPDVIYPGQKLIIPVSGGSTPSAGSSTPTPAPVPTSAASPTVSASVYHTVKLGDTLDKIARANGTTAAAIIAANGISNPDLIWVGQKLLIPGTSKPGAPVAQPTAKPKSQPAQPAPASPTIHVVKPGDTLGQIAQRYGTTVAAILAANDLPSADVLGVGQRLIIPKGGGSVATTAVKPTKFVVSISQQRCWLYAGETLIAKWVCSTGRRGSGTRPGTYRIQSKLPKAYGSTWNIWMPYWLGIYWAGASENGIHGLPWNAKSGAQVWTGYVGTPITYGCVMLDNVNAKMLYNMAWIGMPVVIKP